MANIFPFCGVRPKNSIAEAVIAPPYDVLNEQEARDIVASKPQSFLRITRSEVDLPAGSDAHSQIAYEKARDNLQDFLTDGTLQQDSTPCFYLYSQTWQGRTQRGLMALCDTSEYDANLIKKHELTRPDKEQDRTDHIDILSAQTGLVFLTYRDEIEVVKQAMTKASMLTPEWEVTTPDQVAHSLTLINDDALVLQLQAAFRQLPALYIADGHHRSAAASRVAGLRKGEGTSHLFLAGIFPDSELEVMAYNRVVQDLNGHSWEAFMAAVAAVFVVEPTQEPIPSVRGTCTMYIDGQWYALSPKPEVVPLDVVDSLDVSVLQNNVLAPVLGIDNPRTNQRISFVGGIRGHQALSAAVDNGAAVAFHMFPTGIDQLLAVADANRLMPPKSTWFEPKLRGGVLVHKIDG